MELAGYSGAVAKQLVILVSASVVGGAIGWTRLKVEVDCLYVVDSGHFSAMYIIMQFKLVHIRTCVCLQVLLVL